MAEALVPGPRELPARLVLYDGVCGFCDGAVRWLLERDPAGRFCYAPLQGETTAWLRRLHPEIPIDLDTIVLVESENNRSRVFLRSDAVWRVFAELAGPWRWFAWLRWLPRSLRDYGYGQFARRRYHWFGRFEACRMPDAAERARFWP